MPVPQNLDDAENPWSARAPVSQQAQLPNQSGPGVGRSQPHSVWVCNSLQHSELTSFQPLVG
jgi:hypothetical protein